MPNLVDVPENAVLLDALVSAAIPVPEIPVVPLPLPQVQRSWVEMKRRVGLFSN